MADRSISYEFRGKFDNLRAGLSAAGRGVRDFGNDLTGLDRKGAQMRRGLDELGGNAGRMGLALGGAFAVVATKAANFEQSMSFVKAATHETAENMDALREAALEAGAQTAFSATEAASAIENLAKAGVSTKDILAGGLTGALDLAAAGGIDVATAAEQAATAMTQFGLAGEDIPHIADLLAAGAGKAQGEVTDLGAALNQSGLIADQVGLSIEETTGALSAFASAGLLGSDAGTSFKTMLGALTPNSKEAAQLMEQLGISAYDAQGNFVGMAEFAGVLRNALKDMTDEQRQSTLETIFGSDAVRAASILYEQGADGIQSWINKTNDAGYASETAATRMDNLKGDLEQLGGALETAFIGAGEGQSGILRDLTQNLTSLVNAFNGLPGPVKSATGALLGLGALGAGAFWFTAKAVSTIASTRQALTALGITSESVRGKLTLLNAVKLTGLTAGLAIGIPILSNDLDTLGRSIGNVTSATEGLDGVLDALNKTNVGKYADDLGIDMQKLAEDLYQNGESGAYVAEVYADLEKRLDSTGDNIKEAASYWIPGWTSEQNKAAEVTNGLNDVIADNADLMGTAEQSAKDAALAQSGLSGEARNLAESSSSSAEDVTALSEAMKKAQEEAQGVTQSFLDLSAGFNDGKFSFKDWIKELEQAGNAVANFRRNADKALERGVPEGLVTSLQEMGAEGAVQLEHLANATPAQMKRIIAAWKRWERQSAETSNAIANDLAGVGEDIDTADTKAKQFGNGKYVPTVDLKADAFNTKRRQVEKDVRGLDREKGNPFVGMNKAPFEKGKRDVQGGMSTLNGLVATPTISVNTSGATAAIRNLQSSLSAIRDKTIYINEVTRGGRADGGTIGRYDIGGTVPGARMPYGDKVLTYLAPGEEVISNRYGQADRHRELLKAINSNRLANGGTVGLADGGTARRLPGLAFADLPAINLATASLKGLNRALRQSEKALDDEREQRDKVRDAMASLRSDVTTGLRSDLFGEQSGNAWSMANRAGSFNSILATLTADTRAGQAYKADVAALKKKGLDGGALKELLSSGSPEQVAMFADLSRSQLARFEAAFERRQQVTASAGQAAGAATFGKELAKQTREMRLVADRVERVEKAIKAEERALKAEHKKDRDHSKRGAGNGSRNRRRG